MSVALFLLVACAIATLFLLMTTIGLYRWSTLAVCIFGMAVVAAGPAVWGWLLDVMWDRDPLEPIVGHLALSTSPFLFSSGENNR